MFDVAVIGAGITGAFIARELGIDITEVVKDGPDSYILTGSY